jgi:hypothetical protein
MDSPCMEHIGAMALRLAGAALTGRDGAALPLSV